MELRVYVNERVVTVPAGAVARDAVAALLPEQAVELDAGTLRLADSRGLPIDATAPLHGGAILRTVPVRSRLDEDTE